MKTLCPPTQIHFQGHFSRSVVVDFEAGDVTSDAGLLLLREVDLGLKTIFRAALAFADSRDPARIEHTVEELLRQRVFAIAAGKKPTGASRRQKDDKELG